MEEIDIIELLRRVKEGKAPRKIQINGDILVYTGNEYLDRYYKVEKMGVYWFTYKAIQLDTKITILDKPIIEEIPLIEIKHD